MHKSGYITTFSGLKFYPLAPKAESVCLSDIAHHLSNLCRFTGAVREFYSVAQHCVHVSLVCDPAEALEGLLHDSPEAYIADLSRPLKHSPELKKYRIVEKEIEAVIAEKFNIRAGKLPSVEVADKRMLLTEMRDMMPAGPGGVFGMAEEYVGFDPYPWTIFPWSPREAETRFLARFTELELRRRIEVQELVGK